MGAPPRSVAAFVAAYRPEVLSAAGVDQVTTCCWTTSIVTEADSVDVLFEGYVSTRLYVKVSAPLNPVTGVKVK